MPRRMVAHPPLENIPSASDPAHGLDNTKRTAVLPGLPLIPQMP